MSGNLNESENLDGIKSILQSNGKSSSHSKSLTSFQKKRISWGPSKVLEFFANEHLIERESQDANDSDAANRRS